MIQTISAYKLWQDILRLFPKNSKYSLGIKIDALFAELIEAISTASFLPKEKKSPWIRQGISKLETLKVLLQVSWEIRSVQNAKYILLSEPLDKIGKQLGGWYGQNERFLEQNTKKTPRVNSGEK